MNIIPGVTPQQQFKSVLYVSDLPVNTIESDLMQFFQNFADTIIFINIMHKQSHFTSTPQDDRSRPAGNVSAKVIFKDYKSANEARVQLNLRKLKGHAIRLMWDERDNSIRYNPQTNLYVKFIPFNVTPRDVYEYFLQFGDISSAKLNEDANGNHKGYGYITYYSPESAHKAIMETDKKIVWGNKLEVKYFQKKNERISSYAQYGTAIYLTNFPGNYNENDIITLCEKYGEIINYNVNLESFGRISAVVTYANMDCARKAQEELNKKNIMGFNLYCEIYQNKKEGTKGMTTQGGNGNEMELQMQRDMNLQLTSGMYRKCNLHVRNIPFSAKEEDVKKVFQEYGTLRSVKIETYNLVTKVKDEFKEIPTSKGFGYVCYENQESAAAAKEALNERYLPGFESWNRPLLIDYFVPKSERTITNYPVMPEQGA